MRFLIRFLVFFPLAFIIWKWSAQPVNCFLTACAEPVAKALDGFDLTKSITSAGTKIRIDYTAAPEPMVIYYRQISYGTVFLLTLIMAVPDVRHRLRLKILAIGTGLILASQVMRIVTYTLNHYGQHLHIDGHEIYPDIPRLALVYIENTLGGGGNQIIPVIIWFALFFYYVWHEQLREAPVGGVR